MIASLNSDCTTLTLYSEALVTGETKTFVSLELKSRLNCSLTETTVVLDINDIVDSQIEIPATTFYDDATKTTYCDGVYYFELAITYNIDFEDITQYLVEDGACKLIDCTLKCKVLEYYLQCKDRKAYYQYYALQQGNDCDSCYCTEMCSLYTELKNLLNDNSISTTTSGCGCS